jgi:prepilin-type N-terminal cleavage/methylation domain-containing protein
MEYLKLKIIGSGTNRQSLAVEKSAARRQRNIGSGTTGFTLVELLVSIFIISLLTVTINAFARDVFYDSYTLSDSMSAQFDTRHIVDNMATELREAAPSALGAYPLVSTDDNDITFYSDLNNDGLEEQIRYFVSGATLEQGVVVPTGSPLSYNQANEKISTLISGVVSSSTQPIFQYYPSSYAGTSSPLTQPVNIANVSFVRITVIIDKNTNHAPSQVVVTSGVSLRNLKSNQ